MRECTFVGKGWKDRERENRYRLPAEQGNHGRAQSHGPKIMS